MKNWTTISKPIKNQGKGLIQYLSYLTSQSHRNHRKTLILPIYGDIKSLNRRINAEVATRNLIRAKSRKGGRDINSYAQSFVFTLPELNVNPTQEDWKQISKILLKTLVDVTDTPFSDLKNYIFLNVHDQTNPHLNLVVSKVILGEVKKDLQKKNIINILKKSFNHAVLKQLKIAPSDYSPKTKRSRRYNENYYQKNKELINLISEVEHRNEIKKPTVSVHVGKNKKKDFKKGFSL